MKHEDVLENAMQNEKFSIAVNLDGSFEITDVPSYSNSLAFVLQSRQRGYNGFYYLAKEIDKSGDYHVHYFREYERLCGWIVGNYGAERYQRLQRNFEEKAIILAGILEDSFDKLYLPISYHNNAEEATKTGKWLAYRQNAGYIERTNGEAYDGFAVLTAKDFVEQNSCKTLWESSPSIVQISAKEERTQ